LIATGSFEYALPRMHSRLAQRPGQGAWAAIEQARAITPIIDALRETSLATLIRSLTPAPDLHTVDQAARHAWSQAVADAVAWLPPAWSPAISWCGLLHKLPALAHLARGREPAAWMRADAVLAVACNAPAGNAADALSETVLAPLASGIANPSRLNMLWQDHWRALWPQGTRDADPLDVLSRLFARHFTRFRTAQPHEAPQLRRQLEVRLIAIFRRHPFDAAAVFAWLGITALDLERARGELARRIAFPDAMIAT
jgi:hypothetical protein